MNFVQRAIGVLSKPQVELPRAAAEPATTGGLIGGYAAILAALPAIGIFFATLLTVGRYGGLGAMIGPVLLLILLTYALRDLGLTILVGLAAPALAPSLGGQKNAIGGMKLAVYAATPIWVAGFVGALLGALAGALYWLLLIAGFGYAGYIIFLACRPLLGVPEQQAPAFAGILTVGWLVLFVVTEMIVSNIFISMMFRGSYGYGGF